MDASPVHNGSEVFQTASIGQRTIGEGRSQSRATENSNAFNLVSAATAHNNAGPQASQQFQQ